MDTQIPKCQKVAKVLTLFSDSSTVDLSDILSCLWKLEHFCYYWEKILQELCPKSVIVSAMTFPCITFKMTKGWCSDCFCALYLSDFLQLGTNLGQFLFAVLQPGFETLILVQSLCVHLKMYKVRLKNRFVPAILDLYWLKKLKKVSN